MNKYLLLVSAAALSTMTGTQVLAAQFNDAAGHTSLIFNSFSGSDCSQWYLTWTEHVVYANEDSWKYCGRPDSSFVTYGIALKGEVRGYGSVIQLPSSMATLLGAPSYATDYVISAPLRTGNAMVEFGTYDGYSNFEANAGTYTLGHYEKVRPARFATRSGQPVPIQQKILEYARAHGMPVPQPGPSR